MPKAASKPPLPPAPFLGNLASGTMPIPIWTKKKNEDLARDVAVFRGATLKRDIRYGFATELHKGAKVDLVVDLLGDGRIDLVHDDYLATIGRVMPIQLQRGPRATPYAAGGSRRAHGGGGGDVAGALFSHRTKSLAPNGEVVYRDCRLATAFTLPDGSHLGSGSAAREIRLDLSRPVAYLHVEVAGEEGPRSHRVALAPMEIARRATSL